MDGIGKILEFWVSIPFRAVALMLGDWQSCFLRGDLNAVIESMATNIKPPKV